jgi:hypothetical protein
MPHSKNGQDRMEWIASNQPQPTDTPDHLLAQPGRVLAGVKASTPAARTLLDPACASFATVVSMLARFLQNCRRGRHQNRQNSVPNYRSATAATGARGAKSAATRLAGADCRAWRRGCGADPTRAVRPLFCDGLAVARSRAPGPGKRVTPNTWPRAAQSGDAAGWRMRQRGHTNRGLRDIVVVEPGPSLSGRLVMAESIRLIKVQRQRGTVQTDVGGVAYRCAGKRSPSGRE